MSDNTTAIFASGCFWGTEYYLKQIPGVLSTQVGYTGGSTENPTYQDVCTGTTGHAEAIRINYDPDRTDFEALARTFFETHDPTQRGGQGPDLGTQYRSAVFYLNEEQRGITEGLIALLAEKGLDVVTEVTQATTFWAAEVYHQDYYAGTGGVPYCHGYRALF